jgi:uncharacterized protein with HEPN domain
VTRQYKLFIQDILDAINDIVVWKINVIGEATKNIPKTMRES